jgi:hypothetical protein
MWDHLAAPLLASPLALCLIHFIWLSYAAVFRMAENKSKVRGDVRRFGAIPTVERTYCSCPF